MDDRERGRLSLTSAVPEARRPPEGWADLGELGLSMSNYDHTIDEGFEEALRAGGVYGRHAAWEFNGKVWFEDGRFWEEVWRHHEPVACFGADSLEELMQNVNEEWGYE